jgi:hypothetical protein
MGKIVPRNDRQALGEAIVEVLAQRDRFVRPVEEIERHFSVEETVSRYEELFGRYAVGMQESSWQPSSPGIQPE